MVFFPPQRVDFVQYPVAFGLSLPPWLANNPSENNANRFILGGGSGTKCGMPFVASTYDYRMIDLPKTEINTAPLDARMGLLSNGKGASFRIISGCPRETVGSTFLEADGRAASGIDPYSPDVNTLRTLSNGKYAPVIISRNDVAELCLVDNAGRLRFLTCISFPTRRSEVNNPDTIELSSMTVSSSGHLFIALATQSLRIGVWGLPFQSLMESLETPGFDLIIECMMLSEPDAQQEAIRKDPSGLVIILGKDKQPLPTGGLMGIQNPSYPMTTEFQVFLAYNSDEIIVARSPGHALGERGNISITPDLFDPRVAQQTKPKDDTVKPTPSNLIIKAIKQLHQRSTKSEPVFIITGYKRVASPPAPAGSRPRREQRSHFVAVISISSTDPKNHSFTPFGPHYQSVTDMDVISSPLAQGDAPGSNTDEYHQIFICASTGKETRVLRLKIDPDTLTVVNYDTYIAGWPDVVEAEFPPMKILALPQVDACVVVWSNYVTAVLDLRLDNSGWTAPQLGLLSVLLGLIVAFIYFNVEPHQVSSAERIVQGYWRWFMMMPNLMFNQVADR